MLGGGVSNIGLGFTFTARDLATGPINRLGSNFGALHNRVRSSVPMMMTAFVGLAASASVMATGIAGIRGAFGLAEEAGQFGIALADVASISQATATELVGLHDAAIQAGILTQFAPTEAAEGLRNLASNGVMARDAMQALVPVLDFAAAGSISVGDAADISMATLNAYGRTVDDLTDVTDRLMRGTQLSALRADEFLTVMGRAAATGHLFGQSLDDVILALGSMRSSGLPATVATTSLSEAMRRVYTDTEAQRTLTNRFGISLTDQAGRFRSIIDITSELSTAMEGLTDAEKARIVTGIFHVRGMQEFNAISNIQARVMRDGQQVTLRGAEAIAYYREQLANAGGTTEEFRTRRLATFQGQMVLLQGTLQTFSTVLGETFGPVFRPLVLAFTESVNALTEAWMSLPEGMRTFIAVSALVISTLATIGGGLGTVVFGAALIIAIFGEALLIAAAVAAGIVVALAPVFAAFGALVGIGYMLYRAWQSNLGGLRDWFDGWVDAFRVAYGVFVAIMRGEDVHGLERNFLEETFGAGFMDLMYRVRDFGQDVSVVWDSMVASLRHGWDLLGPVFRELSIAFDGLIDAVIGAFGSGANSLTSTVGNVPTSRLQEIGQIIARHIVTAARALIEALTIMVRVLALNIRLAGLLAPVLVPALQAAYHYAVALYTIFTAVLNVLTAIVRAMMRAMPHLNLFHRFAGPAVGRMLGGEQGAANVIELDRTLGAIRPEEQTASILAAAEAARARGAAARGEAPGRGRRGEVRLRSEIDQEIRLVLNDRVLAEEMRRINADQRATEGDMGIWEQPQTVWE